MLPALAVARPTHGTTTSASAGSLVLVVEDNVVLGDMLVMLLEAEGYATALARDGETALELAAELRPALITLDLQLPRLTGHGVLTGLESDHATRRIPVVVLSSDVGDLIPTRQVRCVLVKPNGVSELLDAIRALVGEYHRTA